MASTSRESVLGVQTNTARACCRAHWLSWRLGRGLVAAREKVRVARRLRDLPLATAFARLETRPIDWGWAVHVVAAQAG
jgi:hypothetical protein